MRWKRKGRQGRTSSFSLSMPYVTPSVSLSSNIGVLRTPIPLPRLPSCFFLPRLKPTTSYYHHHHHLTTDYHDPQDYPPDPHYYNYRSLGMATFFCNLRRCAAIFLLYTYMSSDILALAYFCIMAQHRTAASCRAAAYLKRSIRAAAARRRAYWRARAARARRRRRRRAATCHGMTW